MQEILLHFFIAGGVHFLLPKDDDENIIEPTMTLGIEFNWTNHFTLRPKIMLAGISIGTITPMPQA